MEIIKNNLNIYIVLSLIMDTYNKIISLVKVQSNSTDITVIIYWPKSNTRLTNDDISTEMVKLYTGELNVNYNYGINLLRDIHYGKEWWKKHLVEQTNKRFYGDDNESKNTITFEIYSGTDLYKTFKGFKKKMRQKYGDDKSQFHMSDPDCFDHLGVSCNCEISRKIFNEETMKHIYLLTHPNTVHFLQKSHYNPTFKFNQYLDRYIKILNSSKYVDTKDNFCIDNGGILGAYGIRDTHDIDFLYFPLGYNGNIDEIDSINIGDRNIGCENRNHRIEYLRLGYKISHIIHNPDNYFYHNGCKFMSLEILKKFKFNRTHTIGTGHKQIRQKDINDYNLIKDL